MKLRCTDNSIRLRLRKSELATLQQQAVTEVIQLGPKQKFQFSLLIQEGVSTIQLSLTDDHLQITLPQPIAEQWIKSNQVGIETNMETGANEPLHLLIEKDFPCTDREGEDPNDFFGELAEQSAC